MKKQLPAFLVLLLITLIAGLILGGTFQITKDPIEQQALLAAENARKAALPDADTFQPIRSMTADGVLSSASVQGKVGPVAVSVLMNQEGTIQSLTIGDENYAETPEYAAAVQEDAFVSQFIGKKAPFASVKAGAEDAASEGSYTASVWGFAGPVAVTASFDGNTITSFSIGDDNFAETEGYGKKALDAAFAQQFVGKQVPLTLADIDAITGATVTSTAVVNAANKAYNTANATPIDAVTGATVTSDAVVEAVNKAAADTGMDWCYEGLKEGEVVGYVAQTTVQGFGGPVEIIAGVNREKTVTGISVGGSNFSETAGLGAKAKDAAFTNQFAGKNAAENIGCVKAGEAKGENDIDAITAATITSGKVTGGVNLIASYALSQIDALPKPPVEMVKPEITYVSSSKGYSNSPVQVEVGFNGDEIVYLVIGDERFAESDGFGAKALEPSFAEQFIGLTAPVDISDIDAISGATITTNAVVSAVNKSYEKSKPAEEAPAENTAAAPVGDVPVTGNVFTASNKGYSDSPVAVSVTFDAEGKITSLSIGNEKFAETQGVGDKALDPAFAQQFIGKQAPVNMSDIDAISGATVTTEAVINAINKAYSKVTGQ